MPNCSVVCCKRRSGTSNLQKDGVSFHLFPKNPEVKDKWKSFCNNRRTWIPRRTSVICSDHFKPSDFELLASNRRILVYGVEPSLIPNCVCSHHPTSKATKSNDGVSNFIPVPTPISTPPSTQQILVHKPGNNLPSNFTTSFCISSPTQLSASDIEKFVSHREKKMKMKLDWEKIKNKRLHSSNLYSKKKIARLLEILQSLDENYKHKKERIILKKIELKI